jgi:hypothetical protein
VTLFSQIPPVGGPKSTAVIATARRPGPPHSGARPKAMMATGTSCATSAAHAVTRGEAASGTMPLAARRAARSVAALA